MLANRTEEELGTAEQLPSQSTLSTWMVHRFLVLSTPPVFSNSAGSETLLHTCALLAL